MAEIRWKDNSTWSVWIDILKNEPMEYRIEYYRYENVYKLEWFNKEFKTIEEAKIFCYGYSMWYNDACEEIKIEINNILDC